ncbi:von Willebrand factor type A domain-containing protein [Ectothiorhodosinus mongolicus]|uniref:von Willebrand factor type A domain-containing protein n=1 Tax=Ectothiorhodosinus mongolicus TaxID=233100 RepID=A0A1R3VX76_9GAMM|nr:nitric oxide reductase activation protein NorD [Ectothiorhodosinus mongolicus]ULX57038.1 nitric oxide reductase activation protein NorD [Ectothiorhodosinus mongolicus]SIT69582.1 von Willebrand factor type A domain-containing protein [Ectothiorhodosinus mongolicus]
MAIHLEEYEELLEDLPHDAREVLTGAWHEAARVFSPRGLDNYLKGAVALHNLGRGEDLVVSFLQEMPAMSRAIGEDVLPELVNFLLGMASKTSGQVLSLIISTAPLAAERLGDDTLFRGFLGVLQVMLAQAPRGLRPMLENLDRLLTQLTLGGLRRWVNWGAQAYKTDFEGQVNYFSLHSPDAVSVLKAERKGTLFVDVQRRLNIYLRAMWGRDFFMRPTAGDYESREGLKPFIEHYVVHIADAYDDYRPEGDATAEDQLVSGLEVYRAAANHCAAHLVFTKDPLSMEELDLVQMAIIGVIEDARVEELACQQFPGMRASWLALHPKVDFGEPQTIGALLNRLARALLEPDSADPHPWVREGVQLFREETDLSSNQISWNIGVALSHSLGRIPLPEFNFRTDIQHAIYRDDNRTIWESEEYDVQAALEATWGGKQVRREVSVMEMVNELDYEFAGDDAQEVWVLPTEFYLDQEGVTINELEGRPPISEPFHYHEWDYQIQLERPSWVTVLERNPVLGELDAIEQIITDYKPVISQLKYLIESMIPQGMQRLRRQEDGDELDINAAIRAMVDIRSGQQPDTRVMMRYKRNVRDLAVMVLLDMSESANDKVRGQDYSIMDLTRAATVLFADALDRIGDPFALHGFCSDGRHDVHYYRFKDFEQPYNDLVKARLAGMQGSYSTRMGAAMRHAGHYLKQQAKSKKLLIIITDGEPADNDTRDPQYLRHDAKRAVEELSREGVMTYALSLDPHADHYVSRIFGASHFTVLDHVERLPEKLPMLYLGLTR